jgi:peptide chain release factor 2
MHQPSFWDNSKMAEKTVKKCNLLKSWTVPYKKLSERFSNIKELYPEVKKAEDEAFLQEVVDEILKIEETLQELEIRKMLSGELDSKSCFISINAGAGGTESCDWVAMLFRMYSRWVSRRNWKTEIVDRVDGDVAGIKSITFKIEGDFAYGYAKSEKGVHRLVRISPFDSNSRRHTSFASVDVTPIIDDDINIEIKPEELRVDTFRASGAGGQHVNVTDSAVRMVHIPSSIIVTCQNERSQIQNRETCLKMLKSKLYEKQVEKREERLKKLSGEKKEIAWGSQIRSYTFQPYTLVKDNRTKVEMGNIEAVMDGDIDLFVNAYLKEIG